MLALDPGATTGWALLDGDSLTFTHGSLSPYWLLGELFDTVYARGTCVIELMMRRSMRVDPVQYMATGACRALATDRGWEVVFQQPGVMKYVLDRYEMHKMRPKGYSIHEWEATLHLIMRVRHHDKLFKCVFDSVVAGR